MLRSQSMDPAPHGTPIDVADESRLPVPPAPGTLWRIGRSGEVQRVVAVTDGWVRLSSLHSGTQSNMRLEEFDRGCVFVRRLLPDAGR